MHWMLSPSSQLDGVLQARLRDLQTHSMGAILVGNLSALCIVYLLSNLLSAANSFVVQSSQRSLKFDSLEDMQIHLMSAILFLGFACIVDIVDGN